VVAHSGELLGLGVRGIRRVEDGFGGPYAHVAVWRLSAGVEGRRGALCGLTNLRPPLRDATHRATRRSCRLRSLSVRLQSIKNISADSSPGLGSAGRPTRVRQPRWLVEVHGRVPLGSKRKPAPTRPCRLNWERGEWRSRRGG
jgi:hypothetical protein